MYAWRAPKPSAHGNHGPPLCPVRSHLVPRHIQETSILEELMCTFDSFQYLSTSAQTAVKDSKSKLGSHMAKAMQKRSLWLKQRKSVTAAHIMSMCLPGSTRNKYTWIADCALFLVTINGHKCIRVMESSLYPVYVSRAAYQSAHPRLYIPWSLRTHFLFCFSFQASH